MAYVGNTPTTQNFISGTDYFNGTGSQTAFTLSRTVASVNDIQAVVNNVVQVPNDAYTISGTTITFTSAPSAGTQNVYVRYLSTTTQAITPSQNTVSWNTLDSNIQQDLGVMYKNRIINGNMVIDQRNAGASVTQTTSNLYPVDRFLIYGSVTSKFTAQQSSTAPAGFVNSLIITSSAATTPASGDLYILRQAIEGFNVADLNWGSANAKTVTLSFWVRSSLTGTFGGSFTNGDVNRSYPFSYTISAANTWEQKSITVAGDQSGTWNKTNGTGIRLYFNLGAGSSYNGTANAWATVSDVTFPSGSTSVVGTNGATWYLTGVQLEVGTQATAFSTAGGSYGAELALCQRYYEKSYPTTVAVPTNAQAGYAAFSLGTTSYVGSVSGGAFAQNLNSAFFKVTKRTTPSVTTYSYTSSTTSVASNGWNGVDLAANTATISAIDQNGFSIYNNSGSSQTVNSYAVMCHFAASAEL